MTSTIDGDTVGLLKRWAEKNQDAALARLFVEGDARAPELLAACQLDHPTAYAAFLVLRFLEAPSLVRCVDLLEGRHGCWLYSRGGYLSDADFQRIEHWLAEKQTPNGYRCGESDDCQIDDALVYSLILDGSTRCRSLLARMRAFAELCMGGDTLFLIEDTNSMLGAAKTIGHDLKIEPDIRESIRASAFFLPSESRENSAIVAVARTPNRILLKATYHVGLMGGGIYYIVLHRDGSAWQYALIEKWAAF